MLEKLRPTPHTQLIASLGTATASEQVLRGLVEAGMDVARLNFAHRNDKQFEYFIKTVRSLAKQAGRHVEFLADLQGPKIRIGELKEDLQVKPGDSVILGPGQIPITYKNLEHDLKTGSHISIADGYIDLTVRKIEGGNIHCHVNTPGTIYSNAGLNARGAHLAAAPLNEKDQDDLKFALKHNMEIITLSFTRNAKDIEKLRKLINDDSHKIIAKIERPSAIDNLEEIAHAADGLMVARGDLGLELPMEDLPYLQHKIIHTTHKLGKESIVATHLLQSMLENPIPTRAELSDIANAVYEGATGLMLAAETSSGKHPVLALEMLKKLSRAAEDHPKKFKPHL